MASYDLTQTIYLFNFLSNAASNVSGSAQELAGFLNMAVTSGGMWSSPSTQANPVPIKVNGFLDNMNSKLRGGDWTPVGKPGIFQSNDIASKNQADNALFIVHSPSLNTYVVAIAGTNPHSSYDWVVEDGSVGADLMVDFPLSDLSTKPTGITANSGAQQVSLGTAIGIYNLMTQLVDEDGNTLDLELILSGLDAGATLIFSGHSLGGALSSALAFQIQHDLGAKFTIQALPTAGPSPGNAMFAESWGNAFPVVEVADLNEGNNVTCLNQLVYNNQDMVPHAWDLIKSDVASLANGQYPNMAMPAFFYDVGVDLDGMLPCCQTQLGGLKGDWVTAFLDPVDRAQSNGTKAFMKRLPNNIGLTGTFPLKYWSDKSGWVQWAPPGDVFLEHDDFTTGLALVHVWQYHQFFNIDPSDITRVIDTVD